MARKHAQVVEPPQVLDEDDLKAFFNELRLAGEATTGKLHLNGEHPDEFHINGPGMSLTYERGEDEKFHLTMRTYMVGDNLEAEFMLKYPLQYLSKTFTVKADDAVPEDTED